MKKINLKSTVFAGKPGGKRRGLPVSTIRRIAGLFIVVTLIVTSGCRKVKDEESYYGYGKLTVECEGKCHISFGTADRMNIYDVDSNTGIYFIRYQTKYNLAISITPTDRDQNITMNVYSREQKQIFHNAAKRKLNEVWESQIVIP
jgi:hypothetical protein